MPNQNWRDVIREQKEKEHNKHLAYMLLLSIVVISLGIYALYYVFPDITTGKDAVCINMLSDYDPSVKQMGLTMVTQNGGKMFYNSSVLGGVSKEVVLIVDGSKLRGCQLTVSQQLLEEPEHSFDCSGGNYYYTTGQKNSYKYIATQAVLDSGETQTKLKYFSSSQAFEGELEALKLRLRQNNCEEI